MEPETQSPMAAMDSIIRGPASASDQEPANKLATAYWAVRRRSFRTLSVMSRAIFEAPMIWPFWSLTGETARSLALQKRSEEHTSELQSRFDLVCRLLLEKKKKNNIYEQL